MPVSTASKHCPKVSDSEESQNRTKARSGQARTPRTLVPDCESHLGRARTTCSVHGTRRNRGQPGGRHDGNTITVSLTNQHITEHNANSGFRCQPEHGSPDIPRAYFSGPRAAAWVASLGVSPEASVGAPQTTTYTPGLPDLDLRAIEVPADQVDQAIATLSSRLDIQWVERVATVRKHETVGITTATPTTKGGAPVRARLLDEPNDTRFAAQWGLVNSGAKSAWPVAGAINAGIAVTVAVIDTGVQLDHPDLINRLAPTSTWGKCLSSQCTAYSASDSTTFPTDGDGHGTHVAGIIAAETDNAIGVAGVAGDRPVLLMPVQVLDAKEMAPPMASPRE